MKINTPYGSREYNLIAGDSNGAIFDLIFDELKFIKKNDEVIVTMYLNSTSLKPSFGDFKEGITVMTLHLADTYVSKEKKDGNYQDVTIKSSRFEKWLGNYLVSNYDANLCYKGHLKFEDSSNILDPIQFKNFHGSPINDETVNGIINSLLLLEETTPDKLKEFNPSGNKSQGFNKLSENERLTQKWEFVTKTLCPLQCTENNTDLPTLIMRLQMLDNDMQTITGKSVADSVIFVIKGIMS